MQPVLHPPMQVLFVSYKSSLSEISQYIGTAARDLYAEAARQNLLVTGPLYWIYDGADGKPDTVFKLEIAVPVSGIAEENGIFLAKKIPAFNCFSQLHIDGWEKLGETYQSIIQQITEKDYSMNGICREIYLNIDFANPEHNRTEVQVGIV